MATLAGRGPAVSSGSILLCLSETAHRASTTNTSPTAGGLFPCGMFCTPAATWLRRRREKMPAVADIARRRAETRPLFDQVPHLALGFEPHAVAAPAAFQALDLGHRLPVHGRHGLHRGPRQGVAFPSRTGRPGFRGIARTSRAKRSSPRTHPSSSCARRRDRPRQPTSFRLCLLSCQSITIPGVTRVWHSTQEEALWTCAWAGTLF